MGRPQDCNPCCAGPTDCGVCGEMEYPRQWQVTFSGVTDDECSGCNVMNRTWTMSPFPDAFNNLCVWEECFDGNFGDNTGNPSYCFNEKIAVRFFLSASSSVFEARIRVLQMYDTCLPINYDPTWGATIAVWDGTIDCETMTATVDLMPSFIEQGCTWPASLTVTAVA